MLAPVRTVAPAITPVLLAEAKVHLHVDHSDDDAMITLLIAAAVTHLDGWTGILGRCLVEQTWRQDYEAACQILPLPLGPIIEVVKVGYTDADGNPATVAPADYELKTDGGGRGGVLTRSEAVPYGRPASVTYKAGYATTPAQTDPVVPAASTVPDAIKIAIILHVKMNYETIKPEERESYQRAFDALIAPYRRIGV